MGEKKDDFTVSTTSCLKFAEGALELRGLLGEFPLLRQREASLAEPAEQQRPEKSTRTSTGRRQERVRLNASISAEFPPTRAEGIKTTHLAIYDKKKKAPKGVDHMLYLEAINSKPEKGMREPRRQRGQHCYPCATELVHICRRTGQRATTRRPCSRRTIHSSGTPRAGCVTPRWRQGLTGFGTRACRRIHSPKRVPHLPDDVLLRSMALPHRPHLLNPRPLRTVSLSPPADPRGLKCCATAESSWCAF